MNTRIKQVYGTNVTVYVTNPNAKLPQVLMRVKNGITNYYVYGSGLLYQITETGNATNTVTYHYDYRGSTIALTDDSGFITDKFEYSAYATLTYRAGSTDTPFLFNGKFGVQTDPNSLLYMKVRYYNPYLCRFINPDPTGFSGGLNFYAYANGNPIILIDPFGLQWIQAGIEVEVEGGNGATIYPRNPYGSRIGRGDINAVAAEAANAWQALGGLGVTVSDLIQQGVFTPTSNFLMLR